MSYTVLARRYRSSTFDEVIGQEHVAQTLKRAIESDRVAHAYLFCGTRGVGKTSMARILAKALNCRSFDAPTTTPCGKCDSCVAIARGDDIDVIEIDAASNTGVDNVRDIIENSQYRPARSRFKVYIIDEVHMLSKNAFNALLKTLEEPPGHVKFILATTEPEKVLPTILSRCQRYDFRNIPTREIAGHLRDISKQEKIKADDDALLLVAKAGAGSMRDSLSLLDRLLSIGEKQLTVEMIEHLLGLPKSQVVFDLADAIGNGDVRATLSRANAMIQAGLSVDGLVAALTDHLRNLLVLRTCGAESELVEVPGLSVEEMAAQSERFDPVALTQDIVILEELRRHVRQSQAGRALLDATLVRMAMADQFASIGELLGRVDRDGASAATGAAGARSTRPAPPPPARAATPARSPAPAARPAPGGTEKKKPDEAVSQRSEVGGQRSGGEAQYQDASAAVELEPSVANAASATALAEPPAPERKAAPSSDFGSDDGDDDLPAVGRVWEGPKQSLASLLKQHSTSTVAAGTAAPTVSAPNGKRAGEGAAAGNIESVDPTDLPGVWQALLDLLSARGPVLTSVLQQGRFVGVEDGRAVIRYTREHETFVRMFEKNGKKDQIREALSQVLNQSVGVVFEVVDEAPAAESPSGPNGAPAARPRSVAPATARPAPTAPVRPPEPPPGPPAVRVTPELVQSLRESQPLIKAVMDRLGGQVIKVE
jgi:DNA polymerase III subunit gamma/tau